MSRCGKIKLLHPRKTDYRNLMLEQLNMGGYAVFVWSAYFIALGLTLFLYKKSVKQLKLAEKRVEELGLVSKEVEVKEAKLNQTA